MRFTRTLAAFLVAAAAFSAMVGAAPLPGAKLKPTITAEPDPEKLKPGAVVSNRMIREVNGLDTRGKLQFAKFSEASEQSTAVQYPLQFEGQSTAVKYPLTSGQRDDMLEKTNAVSPFVDTDAQLETTQLVTTCEVAMDKNNVPPPAEVGSVALWEEFSTVIQYQKMRNDGIWVVSTTVGDDCETTCASKSRFCTAESQAAQTKLNTKDAIKAAVLEATGNECAELLLVHSRDYHGAPFVTNLTGELECVMFTPAPAPQQSSCTGLAYPNLQPLCRCFKDEKLRHTASGAGHWSTEVLELPELFATFTMEKAAQEVRNDFPTHWPTELAKQFLKEKTTMMDPTIVPQMSKGVFVNRQVLLSRVIGWAVSTVSPTAFACKWKYGRARPEELAWAVHKQSCTVPDSDDVDISNIETDIANMRLASPTDFTAYDEGSPNHPSYPAMHSAASSASLFFPVLMDLTQEQIEEARKLDYAVATSRSFAGVHYPSDNLAGLAIGQQVVADALPGMLEGMGFGEANVAAAIDKIEKHKHNWFVWEARGCAKDSNNDGCKCPCCLDDTDQAGCP